MNMCACGAGMVEINFRGIHHQMQHAGRIFSKPHFRPGLIFGLLVLTHSVMAQVTFTDSFTTPHNYLSTGVAGTIWDGLYLGAGEFSGATGNGGVAGSVSVADAGLTTGGALTLASLQTDWEGAADDGAFLYKVVTGNFDLSVRIVPPIDAGSYNLPGLMVRAFGAGGAPTPGSAENFLLFGRFDQFSIANMSKNNVNGAKTDAARGTYPNTNYWLRLQRVGNVFTLYEKAAAGAAWTSVGTVTRADFAGLPLQVGIEHACYGGGATRVGRFDDFSLSVSNLTSSVVPAAAASLTATPQTGLRADLTWTPGAGSSGSVVVLWTGSPVLKQIPAAATTYSGNASFGAGATLPATNHFVVYAGTGNGVTVSNLVAGQTYHAAVFAYTGAGSGLTYARTPALTSFVATNVVVPAGPLLVEAELVGTNVLVSFNPVAGKWYRVQYSDSLSPVDWKEVSAVAQLAVGASLNVSQLGGATASQRFYRVQQFDSPPVKGNLATAGTPTTSFVSAWENLNAINDGFEPEDSSDHSQGGYGNWPNVGTQWVEYEWSLPITTCRSDVYWWSDGGGILPPAACRLKYWNGSAYVLVPNATGLGVAVNQYNITTHAPVTTTRLRLEFDSGGASTGILEWKVYDAGNSPTNWPGAPESSQFAVKLNSGAITGLKRKQDAFVTEFFAGRLGDLNLKYRQTGTNWIAAQTAALANTASFGWNSNSTVYSVVYRITNGVTPMFTLRTDFDFSNDAAIRWNISLTNLTAQALEIGDLGIPFPMNTTFSTPSASVYKHSFISGHASWMFWMRPNSVGPYLTLTTADDTKLEFWDQRGGGNNVYQAYIHSKAEGAVAVAQGSEWRQTNTSLTLTAGGAQTYGLKLQWADDYDDVRQTLVDEGKFDIHIAPGMTIPTNLFAQFALRTTQTVNSVVAEFPATTQVQFVTNRNGYQIYQAQFTRLGENQLTVNYGNNRQMFLEFFVTEPLEVLISKRAQFLAAKQVVDPTKWYDGLYGDWNMASQTLVTPDNYDLITGFVRYSVASDDAGLSRPAYMAVKNAALPVQSEVTSLDRYIEKFVWGGLQRTTNETYAYGIYGVQDWYSNRNSADTGTGGQLHIWRIYDYPHIVTMYEGMYRVAKFYPQITTALPAQEYLRRAYGTAIALFTVPLTVTGWSAYQTGLMNELAIEDLIKELEAEGWNAEAANLRAHWEQKVNYFVLNSADLFGSEYAFDSTGFETQQALARYGIENAATLGATNPAAYRATAEQFMERQMAANIFCRGWLETTYYHYGSDFRQQAGDYYTLSYMAQMGGWAVLDYALKYATNPPPYLRLAYGSYLSSWALMNTGTPDSNYGFWYPGAGNDGACGGGFEPSPYTTTWLGQPCRRGSWYYSCEQNLAFCGAIRMAATVIADDPIFGRFCYGGDWQQTTNLLHITPKDGVRQRFHAMLNSGQVNLQLDNDHFSATVPMLVREDFSQMTFVVTTPNPAAHTAKLRLSVSIPGAYTVTDSSGVVATLNLTTGTEATVLLPFAAGVGQKTITITR